MKYTFAETFVGAGGAHIGFKSKGFKSVYAIDIDENSIKTLLYNNQELEKECVVDIKNILELNSESVLKRTGLEIGDLDVLFGGIVCKGFSLAGERSPNDERNYFYHKQLEIVEVLRPKISIIENVKGILNAKVIAYKAPDKVKAEVDELWQKLEDFKGKKAHLRKTGHITEEFNNYGLELKSKKTEMIRTLEDNNYLISVVDEIKELYEKIGYKFYIKTLNSSSYGAATKRERVIMVALRNDIKYDFSFPEITHSDVDNSLLNIINVENALNSMEKREHDIDNLPMKHNEKTLRRFKFIPQGKNIIDVLDELPEDLKISAFYSRGNTMRLDPKKPSPTLVPGHSNFPIHPYEDRSITVREAAVITGFPNDYRFFGSHTKRCELVGNAVPPKLSEAIAEKCIEVLNFHYQLK